MPKQIWFKRKWYGWGWYPSTWQGYVITFLYIILVMLFALTIDNNSTSKEILVSFILPFVLLTVAFFRICYLRGESPRWQWGRPKEEDNS